MSWLKAKVEAQASALEEENVYVGTGSQSSMLVRSKKRSDISKGLTVTLKLSKLNISAHALLYIASSPGPLFYVERGKGGWGRG